MDQQRPVRGFISRKWVMEPGEVDVSANIRNINPILPTELKPPQYYSATNPSQLTFNGDSASTNIFPSEAYIEAGFQLIDSVTGLTYPPGAPVAFKPSLASVLFDKFTLSFNGQVITSTPALTGKSTFLMQLINYSFDYLTSGAYQVNAFILDQAGATQNTDGLGLVAASTPYPSAGFYTPERKYHIAFEKTPAIGSNITLGENLGVATAVISTAAGDTITPTIGFNPIILRSDNDNSSFWLRQALTNQTQAPGQPGTGRIWQARIKLNEFIPYYQSYRSFQRGGPWQLVCYPGSVNDMVQRAGIYPETLTATTPTLVNDAAVWIKYLWLMMPSELPSRYLATILDRQLQDKATFQHVWNDAYTQLITEIPSGGSSFSQQFSVPVGLVDWLVLQFVPSSYINNQLANQQCSILPDAPAGECPVSMGYLGYQGGNYPSPAYGTFRSDNIRLYETFLELCNRDDEEAFGPTIDINQYLNGYTYLVFDLRGRGATASATQQTNFNPNITFVNAFNTPTKVYAIAIKKQKSQYTIERPGGLDTVKMVYQRDV